jgi:hypothetical protein
MPQRVVTFACCWVEATFDPHYRFSRFRLEPGGRVLPVEPAAPPTTVVVSQLDVHLMVVGDRESKAELNRPTFIGPSSAAVNGCQIPGRGLY